MREEPKIYFEHLIRGDLGHVVNLPRDFNYAGAKVSYEGELEPSVSGEYNFIMYYSGYQTIYIDNKKVVDCRWRTAWNPNSYKFSVKLEKGKRVPVKIEWEPNGGVAYCGLRAYKPVDDSTRKQMSWWGEMQDMVDYYFVYGTDMDDVISGYRTLTGKSQIMPKWGHGLLAKPRKVQHTGRSAVYYHRISQTQHTYRQHRNRLAPLKQDSWGQPRVRPRTLPQPLGDGRFYPLAQRTRDGVGMAEILRINRALQGI